MAIETPIGGGRNYVVGKPSPRWGLMSRFRVYTRERILYLWRLRIFETPVFSSKLHLLFAPDPDRDLHDHPWTFCSLVLWGWYEEEIYDRWAFGTTKRRTRRVRWFNFKRSTDLHRIVKLSRRPVVTLVLCGPRRRVWGFQTERGWVPYTEYV